MSDDPAIPQYAIAKLSLAPGDVLVVKANNAILSREAAERMRDSLAQFCDGARVMVIDDTIDLSVLTKADIDARATPAKNLPAW